MELILFNDNDGCIETEEGVIFGNGGIGPIVPLHPFDRFPDKLLVRVSLLDSVELVVGDWPLFELDAPKCAICS